MGGLKTNISFDWEPGSEFRLNGFLIGPIAPKFLGEGSRGSKKVIFSKEFSLKMALLESLASSQVLGQKLPYTRKPFFFFRKKSSKPNSQELCMQDASI